ncbi:unnamed protein product [Cuscuta europaea]|uniref:Uncharacterized protein n=1 Tax=Cuscuta europaea TaxID=41803 RepID=A0A9P1E8X8_CUSEU|nr:unnamed protein product [Cuscuta europaea]
MEVGAAELDGEYGDQGDGSGSLVDVVIGAMQVVGNGYRGRGGGAAEVVVAFSGEVEVAETVDKGCVLDYWTYTTCNIHNILFIGFNCMLYAILYLGPPKKIVIL